MGEKISRRGAQARRQVSRRGAKAQRYEFVRLPVFSAPLRLCVIISCMLLGCAPVEDSPSASSTLKNAPPLVALWPDWSDISGHEVNFRDPNTKAIAMIFVLPDCPICNSYTAEFNRLHEEYSPRGIQIILVQSDPTTTDEQARRHADEFNITCPVALDPHHSWVFQFSAKTAPEAFVFAPYGDLLYRGRINDQYVGLGKRRSVVTSHDLRDALEAILAGKPVPQPRTEAVGCPIPDVGR